MIRFELKKIFSRFMGKMTFAILIVILGVVSWLAVSSVDFVDANGKNYTGIGAVRQLQDMKDSWAGVRRQIVVGVNRRFFSVKMPTRLHFFYGVCIFSAG